MRFVITMLALLFLATAAEARRPGVRLRVRSTTVSYQPAPQRSTQTVRATVRATCAGGVCPTR